MKGLYKLAVAFEKASQAVPSTDQVRNISEKGPFGGAFQATKGPKTPGAIDPSVQKSLNDLGYQPALKIDGLLGEQTQAALNWFRDTYKFPAAISPDVLQTQIKNMAAKGVKPNQIAFKVPGEQPTTKSGPVTQNTGDLIRDLNQSPDPSQGYVGPNHFVNTNR